MDWFLIVDKYYLKELNIIKKKLDKDSLAKVT